MFTDIVGYSAMMSKDEKQAMGVLEKNRKIHKSALSKFNGEYIKEIGDGNLSIFNSSYDAVSCAIEIQKSCCKEPSLKIRIGIHIGDIIISGGDVFGDGVNIASRIESVGEPGGIYFSEKVYDDIRNKTEIEVEFFDEKMLKNIPNPVKIYAIKADLVVSKNGKINFEKKTSRVEKSIIVLPFDDISPDKDNEYFSDGLTEEIITDLSHIHDLLVISRSSAMTFKGTKQTIPEIVKKVNVRYVLEGSVRKAGNSLRITAQLIDATTDAHLWAEKYSGTLDDVFDIQEKVSRSIVDALKVRLSPKENKQIAERPIDNVQAYECYLRAMREMHRWNEDGIERALQDLQLGLDIIGDNVLLFAGMGLVYCNFYEFGIRVTEETLSKAEEYAFKVHRLEPNSSLSYTLLGRIERFRGSSLKAIKYFKQALSIDPNDQEASLWLGFEYSWKVGKPDITRPMINKLIDRDPLSPINHMILASIYWLKGEVDNALNSYYNALKLEPDSIVANFFITYLLFWSKQYDKACAVIDRIEKEESADQAHKIFSGWLLFLKHALKGEKDKALELITEDMRNFFWNDPDLPLFGAGSFALVEEKEEAIRWLEHAIKRGNINYPYFETDPFLDNIRGEERFKKLMVRVKHEWENFEV